MSFAVSAEALRLRPTRPAEIDFVLALEGDGENAPFIGSWTRDEHLATLFHPEREHWIVESGDGERKLGYLIAYDLRRLDCGAFVKRLVVADKSRGVGREALRQFCDHAFRDLGAPFVWLSVKPENERGLRAYRGVGFSDFAVDATRRAELSRVVGGFFDRSVLLVCHSALPPAGGNA